MTHSKESTELDLAIENWLKWDNNQETKKSINGLIADKNWKRLQQVMIPRLSFGTAGIRGEMGFGFSRLNDLVIIQTAQGIAEYLLQFHSKADGIENMLNAGVVIGFDSRHNSNHWAHLMAMTFLNKRFNVYLFPKIVPTPFVPFAVLHYQASLGIVITASHNPKNDNGVKVYAKNGAQILPPHDKMIQDCILKNLAPEPNAFNVSALSDYSSNTCPKRINPAAAIEDAYYNQLRQRMYDINELNAKCYERFVYTPLHGVGAYYIDRAMSAANFAPVVHVDQQREPDPDFPTVLFPNPEEGLSALHLAMEKADTHCIQYVLANDPDADRMTVAQKTSDGTWKIFSGNEVGTLLGWWLMHIHRQRFPTDEPRRLFFIASTVSSKMLKSIAKAEGLNFVETLTGFKWMANKAIEIEAEGGLVLLAYEEAIGFMCSSMVLDKDGISALVNMAQLIAFLKRDAGGITLLDKLDQLYDQYGYHCVRSSYYINHEPSVTFRIFERLRHYDTASDDKIVYPASIGQSRFKVVSVRDSTTGYDSSQPDEKSLLPKSSSSQMITFRFENNIVATIRVSGTEPKIKYYVEAISKPGDDKKKLQDNMDSFVAFLVEEFLEPAKNNLTAKAV